MSLATAAAITSKKLFLEALTDPEKSIKNILLILLVPILVLLLLIVVPLVLITSIPIALASPDSKPTEDQIKYLQMYQQAIITVNQNNQNFIESKKKSYSNYNIQLNVSCTLTWQALMAIDAVRYTQDFSKVKEKDIVKLGEKFMERTVKIDGKTATITVTTKSFDSVLDILGFNETDKGIANNIYQGISESSSAEFGDSDISSEIPLFHQWDDRWGNKPYGSHGTISSSGCGPTSFAMIATGLEAKLGSWDTNHDNILDPSEAAAYSVSNGFRGGGGTDWGYFPSAGQAMGLTVQTYDVSQHDQVLNELKAGHPVIASVGPGHFTQSGHFIVLVSVNADGKIKVNDPNRQVNSDTPWDFSIIVSEALQFWAFNNPNRTSLTFKGTAYTGAVNEGNTGTALLGDHSLEGKDLRNKYIAVDPSVIPLGSKVLIKVPEAKRYQTMPDGTKVDMNGYYTAVDTGSDIKGYHIDIYFGTGDYYKNLAENNWGVQSIKVFKKK